MLDDLSELLKQQDWKIEANLGNSGCVYLLVGSFVLPEASDAPVQKLVVEDEEGNVTFETDGSLVGKLIEVRFKSLRWESVIL